MISRLYLPSLFSFDAYLGYGITDYGVLSTGIHY